MPTSTYYRLPEEKRQRLMEACWAECGRSRFSEVSINRIIAAAHIPRGSFYQYFTDKEDLIRFLLEDMRQYFIALIRDILLSCGGDLLALPVRAFDHLVRPRGEPDPMLGRFVRVLQLNQGIDTQIFVSEGQSFLPQPLWEAVDTGRLRRQDREFADHVFHLMCAVLAFAVAGVLKDPGQWQRQREILQARVDLVRNGCAAPAGPRPKEETT